MKLVAACLSIGLGACGLTDPAGHPTGTGGDSGDSGDDTSVDGGAAASAIGFADSTGTGNTVTLGGGAIDTTGAFFTALGSNGRSCATCHDQTTGWSVTPAALQARFAATGGDDPAFRAIDGATSPTADTSTLAARQQAYALLLARGVFRIGLPIPDGADFTLAAVDDPYGYASAAELSLFRRPRPSTNLTFTVQVMWDGREPDLAHQAADATTGHEQAASAEAATMAAVAAFESTLVTAQDADAIAGVLPAAAGPDPLCTQSFHAGINDSQSAALGGFDRDVFTLFDAWSHVTGTSAAAQRQASIARGQQIFDGRPFQITNVGGLPDQQGTCSTCHDTPNVGDHSVALPLDLGLAAANRRMPDEPLYTLRDTATGATVQLTDPGRALVTGQLADAGKFFVPVLRGLAMRAPYFHDGSARDLDAVVGFYRTRFHIQLSPQDQADLVAFLGAL
jgi:cytochrome c peroxidase